jgi:hypothetical protein
MEKSGRGLIQGIPGTLMKRMRETTKNTSEYYHQCDISPDEGNTTSLRNAGFELSIDKADRRSGFYNSHSPLDFLTSIKTAGIQADI